MTRGGSRIFEGGVHLRSTSKKRGGGPRGGPALGPMLKSLHRGPKGGGPDPLDPPPPWIRYCMTIANLTNATYRPICKLLVDFKLMCLVVSTDNKVSF